MASTRSASGAQKPVSLPRLDWSLARAAWTDVLSVIEGYNHVSLGLDVARAKFDARSIHEPR